MIRYIGKRLVIAIPTIILISMFVFSLQKLLPGDAALIMAGDQRDPAAIAYYREKYHLLDPIPTQYVYWVKDMAHGDFGMSLRTSQPVLTLIGQKLPVTIQLAVMSMFLALVIGIPTGILSAVKKNTLTDYVANIVALSGLSIPSFWLGIMMILLFSVKLGWLPASGYVSLLDDPVQSLRTMLMPSLALGAMISSAFMRHTRSAMLTVLKTDYVRTARAKGLRESVVVLKHAFRNAMIPVVTVATLIFGELLAGAVLIEQVFTIPGFGKLIVDAVFNRDYAVVQGVVLCTGLLFILMNLVADVFYVLLNPRLRGSL